MAKKISFAIVIILSLVAALNLIRQITDSLQASSRLDKAADELSALQDHNRQLKNRLSEVQNVTFVEEQARNKLNLARPNETVVIIPQQEIDQVLKRKEPPAPPKTENWQGWLKLFF